MPEKKPTKTERALEEAINKLEILKNRQRNINYRVSQQRKRVDALFDKNAEECKNE